VKRAYLVLGPESSGTRWLTGLLIKAGCSGSDDHVQPWDTMLPANEPLVAWRRSFPHGGEWPNVKHLVTALRARHYEITALVMTRDWFAMSRSQAQFQPAEDVADNIQRAYRQIFMGLTQTQTAFVVVSYEAALVHPAAFVNSLLGYLGLGVTLDAATIGAIDGNAKWYEQVTA